MPSFEDYRAASIDERVARLARTPGEVEAAIAGRSEADLRRRPDATNWAAVEVVCHLRDVEELFQLRFHTIVALEEPRILAFRATAAELEPWRVGGAIGHPLDPDRWAEERQYRRQDARQALAALARRRGEVLSLLRGLAPADWKRVGVHIGLGPLSLADWAASLASHDDNHLEQLRTTLVQGEPRT